MQRLTNKSLGIFGGSFDPPHKGHLKISLISIRKLKLKKIYWVITKKNPFKKKALFTISQRMKMCKKLTNKNKRVKIKYVDKLIKSSNTIDVLNHLIKKNKKTKLFLIIGSDNVLNFHKWKSWKKILNIVQLVIFARKGYDQRVKKAKILKYLGKDGVIFINNKKIDVSSSQLRKNYLK